MSRPSSSWREAVGSINADREDQVYDELPPHYVSIARDLGLFDERLSLVQAKPQANSPDLIAGYWHVCRHNDGLPDSYMPVQGQLGEYREPDGGLVQELRSRDLWNDDNFRAMRSQYERDEEQARADEAARDEERREQIHERVDSSQRLSVRF